MHLPELFDEDADMTARAQALAERCQEIVSFLVDVMGVQEVAAIGVDDVRSGEAVKIVVVRKDRSLTEEDLLAHCRRHLTGYKVPKIVEFRDQPLPRTNLGKIMRRALRSQ